jgi:serine/threonine-protein kinase
MAQSPLLSDLGPDRDPLVGLVLAERYLLVRRLGQGGMGAVYEGLHQVIGKRVAVKLLHPQLAGDPALVSRFLNEARAAATLGHPHIVDALDAGRAPDGTPFLVLEFLEGRSLGEVLEQEGPLAPARAVAMVRPVASALKVAHDRGIIHRDLKPDNLFLARQPDGQELVKVLDFGISKFGNAPGGATRTGAVMGTPAFMAPEQLADSSRADARSDIYALGVVLYQLLSGTLPFEGDSLPQLAEKVTHQPPPPLEGRVPGLPASLVALVHQCLEKDPSRRFRGMDELGAALDGLGPLSTMASLAHDTFLPQGSASTGPGSIDTAVRQAASGSVGPSAAALAPTVTPPPLPTPAPVPVRPKRSVTLAVAGLGAVLLIGTVLALRADKPEFRQPVLMLLQDDSTVLTLSDVLAVQTNSPGIVGASPGSGGVHIGGLKAGSAEVRITTGVGTLVYPVQVSEAQALALVEGDIRLRPFQNLEQLTVGDSAIAEVTQTDGGYSIVALKAGLTTVIASGASVHEGLRIKVAPSVPLRSPCPEGVNDTCTEEIWCDAENHVIACCGAGLVAVGHDRLCACPPGGTEPGQQVPGCAPATLGLRAYLAREVGHLIPAIQHCYEAKLHHNAELQGKLMLDFRVSPEGRFFDVGLKSASVADADVQACTLSVLRDARPPPPPSGGGIVAFPFVFKPADK